jgi:hypothetical protein
LPGLQFGKARAKGLSPGLEAFGAEFENSWYYTVFKNLGLRGCTKWDVQLFSSHCFDVGLGP